MVTCWLLIDTIAMSGSPAARGAAASVARAVRAAASAGGAAVSAVRLAAAASVTMAGDRHRRIAFVDCRFVDRFVMAMAPVEHLPRGSARGNRDEQTLEQVDGSRFSGPQSIYVLATAIDAARGPAITSNSIKS